MLDVVVCNWNVESFFFENQKLYCFTIQSHLSKVVFVFCVMPCTTELYVFLKFSLYSCIDDAGACNFDMTQASKKFAFDSHNDNNFVNFACWSSFATKILTKINDRDRVKRRKRFPYLTDRYKTLEWRCFPNYSLNHRLVYGRCLKVKFSRLI